MFIEADGKRFQVRALCHSTDHANELCAADPTIAVIDVDEATGTTIVADIAPTLTDEEMTTGEIHVATAKTLLAARQGFNGNLR